MKTKESEILLTHLLVTQIKVYIARHTHIHTQILTSPHYTHLVTPVLGDALSRSREFSQFLKIFLINMMSTFIS